MLKWIGYGSTRNRDNKKQYLDLLQGNFIQPKDYDIAGRADVRLREGTPARASTVIVRAKSFKTSLMLIRTKKANTIREYFITLEEILLDYMRYTNVITLHNQSIEKNDLKKAIEEYKDKIDTMESTQRDLNNLAINQTPLEYNEYVYIVTSKRYYPLNMFKIGKTINLKTRLVVYNTGTALDEDELFYLCSIPTADSSGLERQLKRSLINFNYQKEWYRIQQKDLYEIVKKVINQQDDLKCEINRVIEDQTNTKDNITMDKFAKLNAVVPNNESEPTYYSIDGIHRCGRCNKKYSSMKPLLKHIEKGICINADESTCSKCLKMFVSQARLDNHKCVGRFKCERCGQESQSQCDYDRHMARKRPCKNKLEQTKSVEVDTTDVASAE
jgi:hypothetical protein